MKKILFFAAILSVFTVTARATVLTWTQDTSAPDTSRYMFTGVSVIAGEPYVCGFDMVNGNAGVVWRKTGGVWVNIGVPSGSWLDSVTGTDVSHIWVAGNARILFFNGTTWTQQSDAGGGEIVRIQALDFQKLIAVGTNGLRYQTGDGGVTWVKLSNGPGNGIQRGLSANAENDIWIGGSTGSDGWTPYTSHYDGNVWTTYTMDWGSQVTGVDGFTGANIYACGYNAKVWLFDGSGFDLIGLPTIWGDIACRGLAVDGDGNAWVVGDRGFVQSYNCVSGLWELQLYLDAWNKNFSAVTIDESKIYVVGQGGIYTATGNWAPPLPPCDSNYTADLDCDNAVTLTDFAMIAREWLVIDSNIYPLYPD